MTSRYDPSISTPPSVTPAYPSSPSTVTPKSSLAGIQSRSVSTTSRHPISNSVSSEALAGSSKASKSRKPLSSDNVASSPSGKLEKSNEKVGNVVSNFFKDIWKSITKSSADRKVESAEKNVQKTQIAFDKATENFEAVQKSIINDLEQIVNIKPKNMGEAERLEDSKLILQSAKNERRFPRSEKIINAEKEFESSKAALEKAQADLKAAKQSKFESKL